MEKIFCVISHTHWDREWYMPLELFKLKLVDLIDNCLAILDKEPAYIFHLDAQTIVLEDYLTVRPGNRQKLINYVTDGSLVVGPWYLQNDFYLTSGEATIRNLIEGHKIATEFGCCSKIGYAPDQFGNISQLPQILSNFNIDNFIFGRGLSKYIKNTDGNLERIQNKCEFIWEGADGTKALAIYMQFWYNNAQRFSPDIDKALKLIRNNDEAFKNLTLTPYILLMNGVDHLEAQDDLTEVLEGVNKKMADNESIKQYRMSDYVNQVKKYLTENNVAMDTHKGEIRHGNDWELLKGTLSSRPYLKQANVKMQDMLEVKLEPLYSMLELAGAKGAYSIDHFRYMWKDLMKNHPHDSICGCSRDEIHHHMEDNYYRLEHTTNEILRRGMDIVSRHIDIDGYNNDNYVVALANTTELPQSGYVKVIIDIPTRDKWEGIALFDAVGNKVDFKVVSKVETLRDSFSGINLPGMFNVDRYACYVNVDSINSYAFRGYTVRAAKANKIVADDLNNNYTIENDNFKVTVSNDGKINILNKKLNKLFENVIDFEETLDKGDAYVYISDNVQTWASQFPATVNVVERNEYVQTIEISRDMIVPKRYNFHTNKRVGETTVCNIKLYVTVEKSSKTVKLSYKINNTAKDHRIRISIDTGISTDVCISDIPFDVIHHTEEDHYIETHSRVLANTSFAVLEDLGFGVGAITSGQHEVEQIGSKLLFTVARCTGVISRNSTPLQSDQWNCPENQLLRELSGNIWFISYKGDYIQNNIAVLAKQTKNGILSYYSACDFKKFIGGRCAVQDSSLEENYYAPDPHKDVVLKDNKSIIAVDGNGLMVTAVKLAENKDGVVIRTINISMDNQKAKITVNGEISETNMSEVDKYYLGNNIYETTFTPKKIKTIHVK